MIPRRLRWALIVLTATISLAGNPRNSADAATLYDNTTLAADEFIHGLFSERDYRYAQQFIAGESGAVSTVHLALGRIGAPEGQLHVDIYSDDGGGLPLNSVGRLGSLSQTDIDAIDDVPVPFPDGYLDDITPPLVAVDGMVAGLEPGQPYFVILDLIDFDHDNLVRNVGVYTRATATGTGNAVRLLGDRDIGNGWETISDQTLPVPSSDGAGYAMMAVMEPASGDLDMNGTLDSADIDLLTAAIRDASMDRIFDLNKSAAVDREDLDYMIETVFTTWFGDANLDGEFREDDLVQVFIAGEYIDDIADNSTWATGDWNADGEFTEQDLVTAFSNGGYLQGSRAAVRAVPEPASLVMLMVGLVGMTVARRHLRP